MVERLSEKIALKIQEMNPEEISNVWEMKYAIAILINYISVPLLALIVGFLTGTWFETITAVISFMAIRTISDGFHFKSLTVCILFSAAILSLIPHIPIDHVYETAGVTTLALLLNILFLPYKANQPERKRWLVLGIVSMNYLFLSPVLSLTFLLQGVLLIPKRG